MPKPSLRDEPPAISAWQMTLPCTRAEAEALEDSDSVPFGHWPTPPAILSSEPDPAQPDAWQLDIIFEEKPGEDEIATILSRVPSAGRKDLRIEPVPDLDWVTRSQAGLEPITAGRFRVRHDADAPQAPDKVNFLIPASRAFGTGTHETTHGCLDMLDRLRTNGHRFGNVADIGTGTGLLAFAARALWPQAHLIASDIDPVSIEVTEENALMNHVPLGDGPGELMLAVAPGVDHELIEGLAPYDLMIANILAGPLIELAPSLCALLAEGASLILAGLLDSQAGRVIAAYRAQDLRLASRTDNGDWPTLHLRKRRRYGWRRPLRWQAAENGRTDDFGSW